MEAPIPRDAPVTTHTGRSSPEKTGPTVAEVTILLGAARVTDSARFAGWFTDWNLVDLISRGLRAMLATARMEDARDAALVAPAATARRATEDVRVTAIVLAK